METYYISMSSLIIYQYNLRHPLLSGYYWLNMRENYGSNKWWSRFFTTGNEGFTEIILEIEEKYDDDEKLNE